MRTLIVASIVSTLIAAPAFAHDSGEIVKSVALKDGSTVHVFKDGKMGMEDRFGRAFSMPDGHQMETQGGQQIKMTGNEVARLDRELTHDRRGN